MGGRHVFSLAKVLVYRNLVAFSKMFPNKMSIARAKEGVAVTYSFFIKTRQSVPQRSAANETGIMLAQPTLGYLQFMWKSCPRPYRYISRQL